MRMLMACVSAAALAISVPALSQGNSHNNGNRGGGPQADRGNQGGPSARGNPNRGGQNGREARGRGNDRERGGPPPGRGNGQQDRGNGNDRVATRGNGQERAANRGNGQDRAANRGNGRDRAADRGPTRVNPGQANRNARADDDRRGPPNRGRVATRFAGNDFYTERRWNDRDYRDRIWSLQRTNWQGRFCPPGLARQNELCAPPGQYRKLYNRGARWDRTNIVSPDWFVASSISSLLFGNNLGRYDYRYIDGYAYRIDPETRLVMAALPLLGGALGIGQTLPSDYLSYNVPVQYRPFYQDDMYNYRYGSNAIFRTDPETNMILGVSELLANDFVVGQRVPTGYPVYNVPYAYRNQYYDTPQYNYRYNNGQIFRIDPETQLVLAAIDILT